MVNNGLLSSMRYCRVATGTETAVVVTGRLLLGNELTLVDHCKRLTRASGKPQRPQHPPADERTMELAIISRRQDWTSSDMTRVH